ncbi:hypothetical protein EVAR_12521_1 [Eumeta japonica]|uniref:Uncharacterized protein n=1 Tax=Eumeta variegata TaxID=151549 RepID=A0A4C1TPN6_EUMVA|nr:hypothetical protein EVAR_12521_1 [Eumeta japonica]
MLIGHGRMVESRVPGSAPNYVRRIHQKSDSVLKPYCGKLAASRKYHTLTEYGREVAASAVAFFQVSESYGGPPLISPSISVIPPLHQIFYSYPRSRQCTGDSSGVACVHGRP